MSSSASKSALGGRTTAENLYESKLSTQELARYRETLEQEAAFRLSRVDKMMAESKQMDEHGFAVTGGTGKETEKGGDQKKKKKKGSDAADRRRREAEEARERALEAKKEAARMEKAANEALKRAEEQPSDSGGSSSSSEDEDVKEVLTGSQGPGGSDRVRGKKGDGHGENSAEEDEVMIVAVKGLRGRKDEGGAKDEGGSRNEGGRKDEGERSTLLIIKRFTVGVELI